MGKSFYSIYVRTMYKVQKAQDITKTYYRIAGSRYHENTLQDSRLKISRKHTIGQQARDDTKTHYKIAGSKHHENLIFSSSNQHTIKTMDNRLRSQNNGHQIEESKQADNGNKFHIISHNLELLHMRNQNFCEVRQLLSSGAAKLNPKGGNKIEAKPTPMAEGRGGVGARGKTSSATQWS